jgi:hypothetical protein
MIGEVFVDVKNIFNQLGIQIDDDGLDESVYTIIGRCSFRKVPMLVTCVHHYWPHFTQIWIDGISVPAEKKSAAGELINIINFTLAYDHFKINPDSGQVELYAGFYSGMIGSGNEDENETDKVLDEKEFSDGMDGYSFGHLRMLICQMITDFSLFSPLFKRLIKTGKPPSEIVKEFWKKVPIKYKKELQEYMD